MHAFSLSPWRTLLFSHTICSHILVFLHTRSHSLVSLGEWQTQLDKNNLRLINCSSLFPNPIQPPSPLDVFLILATDISQHPFTLSNQTAVYTPLPHTNTTFHASYTKNVLPRWLTGKEFACQWRRRGFDPWVGKIPWRRKWQPIPVFVPGKSHGQRSRAGCSPWGRKESDRTKWLSTYRYKKDTFL